MMKLKNVQIFIGGTFDLNQYLFVQDNLELVHPNNSFKTLLGRFKHSQFSKVLAETVFCEYFEGNDQIEQPNKSETI